MTRWRSQHTSVYIECSRDLQLQLVLYVAYQDRDILLVSPIKRPLFHPFRLHQAGIGQYFHVPTRRGLGHLELGRNVYAANAVLDEIAIRLSRKMTPGVLEPFENPEALFA